MAIEQNSTITVGSGSNARTFGISKSLDQYTIDDLKTVTDWCFSAFEDNLWNANIFDGSFNKTSQVWDTGKSASVHLYKFPSYQIFIEGSQMSGSLFTRNVLIYCNTVVNWAGANIYHGLSTLSRYHVVTDIEIQDLKLNLGNNPDTVVTSMPTCKLGINDVRICPMQLIIDGEDNIYLCLFENWNGAKGGAGNRNSHLAMRGISYDNVEIAYYNYGTGNNGMKAIDGTQNKVLGPSGIDFALHTASNDEVYTTGTELIKVARTSSGGYNYFDYTLQSANTDTPYLTFAYGGLRFNDGTKDYKPIVENGMITGYTDDDTVQSEWDEWQTIKDHVTPSGPPSPTPSGDDIDTQHFGGGTGLGGAENLWLLTTAQMTSLHNAISSCNVPNFEPLNSIISVMGLAIPPTYPLGTDIATLITINIKKADGTLWSTHTEGHICDKQTASFGFTNNIKIKRRYNNFLDYPPYSSHEIFLPLCGWLPLPAYAVGRNLTVYYVHDINTCSVRGLVFCEGSLIGEKYGTMGANIPFSSSGHSLYVGGLITGGVQTLADFATAVSSKGPIALMSAIQGVAEGANTLLASNQNRTSVIGQNQDRTSFADGQYIRIKSTYPDVKIEENFGHTFGFVCNKKGQLKDFKGFTTCDNPHVYGFSCTSDEKDEIERLLREGIIIHIPEE